MHVLLLFVVVAIAASEQGWTEDSEEGGVSICLALGQSTRCHKAMYTILVIRKHGA